MKLYVLFIVFFSSITASASILVNGDRAHFLWDTVQVIDSIENAGIIYRDNDTDIINLDTVDCAFEMYYGCSFYVNNQSGRKLLIAIDGTHEFMNELAGVGVYVDTELARMDVDSLICKKTFEKYSCEIIEPLMK